MKRSVELVVVLLCFAAALGAGLWGSYWKHRAEKYAQEDPLLMELAVVATKIEELNGKIDFLEQKIEQISTSGQAFVFAPPAEEELEKVAAARQLEWQKEVVWETVDQEQLEAAIHAELRRIRTSSRWEQAMRAWLLLGVVDEAYDLFSLEAGLRTEQVKAWYSAQDQVIYVRNNVDTSAPENVRAIRYALVSALVDQNLRAQNLPLYGEYNDDAVLAARALQEGDAAFLVEQTVDALELFTASAVDPSAVLDSQQNTRFVPEFLRLRRMFPSVVGRQFCQQLYSLAQGSLEGDGSETNGEEERFAKEVENAWSILDAAYARPPQSTAEILQPELYLQGWQPEQISWDAPFCAEGRFLLHNVAGQFLLQELLVQVLSREEASVVAQGWAGDSYQLYEFEQQGRQEDGIAWMLKWRDAAAADVAWDAFVSRYEAWYGMEGSSNQDGESMIWDDGMRRLELVRVAENAILLLDAPLFAFQALRDAAVLQN